jgi:hypothetical protein
VTSLRLALSLLSVLVIAGCAVPRLPDIVRPAPAPMPSPVPAPAPSAPSSSAKPPPIANLPITLQGQCSQTDEAGFREQATLHVANNQVQTVDWQLWVGRKGSCRFVQSDFRQTQARPHVELTANDGSGCKLMIWRDDRRITLAHANCQKRCTGNIYEEAWPVMFDPRTGSCARDR